MGQKMIESHGQVRQASTLICKPERRAQRSESAKAQLTEKTAKWAAQTRWSCCCYPRRQTCTPERLTSVQGPQRARSVCKDGNDARFRLRGLQRLRKQAQCIQTMHPMNATACGCSRKEGRLTASAAAARARALAQRRHLLFQREKQLPQRQYRAGLQSDQRTPLGGTACKSC